MMKKLLMGVAALFLFSAQTQATTVIVDSPGGVIGNFIDQYSAIARIGDDVEIDGYCYSACTLVLSYVPAKQVCVQKDAVFGFHSAWGPDKTGTGKVFAREATIDMWKRYPKRVKDMLRARGWNGTTNHPDLIKIPGTKLYKACK